MAAALVGITTLTAKSWTCLLSSASWYGLLGFGIEVIADLQKSRFNADPNNREIHSHRSVVALRHPNYFGEIILWVGVALIALPVLQGWQWIALISPVFVSPPADPCQRRPAAEKKADRKMGRAGRLRSV